MTKETWLGLLFWMVIPFYALAVGITELGKKACGTDEDRLKEWEDKQERHEIITRDCGGYGVGEDYF